MERPKYNLTNESSIETWVEACVISQEWADNARMAAVKRRHKRLVLSTWVMGVITFVAWVLFAIWLFEGA